MEFLTNNYKNDKKLYVFNVQIDIRKCVYEYL